MKDGFLKFRILYQLADPYSLNIRWHDLLTFLCWVIINTKKKKDLLDILFCPLDIK